METEMPTTDPNAEHSNLQGISAFCIMFVTVGMTCFISQTATVGQMYYKSRKPIHAIVLAQAALGIIVTIVTLLASLTDIDCTFRLIFSIVGVNIGNIALQGVLLWKAYLGNNRSKVILILGCVPIVAISLFIIANMTIGKSSTNRQSGTCITDYPLRIVIAKATIDASSNVFLSFCFILVIYRHYRVLGSSIQRTLIKEGLIYCFGVCFSNILTGILLYLRVLGGDTPVIYTIDWYLASYLIIKQLRSGHKIEEETVDDGDTIESFHSKDDFEDPIRTTHHQSINATIVATPSSPNFKLDKTDFTESNSDTNGTVIESSEKLTAIKL